MLDFIRDPSIYNIVRGPFVWIAFLVFIGMSIYKLRRLYLMARNEKAVLPFIDGKSFVRSILHWVVPFGSRNWRMRWPVTITTFVFHIGLVFTPIFLLSHNILWYESWGISWWSLPEKVADIMTLLVIVTSVIFFMRRVFAPEVKFVTSADDFLILAISFFPFLTGFLAYHGWLLPYKPMVMLHMLFGEAMLIAIPFTRLGHMFYFFMTRAWMGSQMQNIWHGKDW
jgi:nitrate reductase gamma subunit